MEELKKFGKRRGIANKPIDEPLPRLDGTESEHIIDGQNNSFIILGRDRPNHAYSGFGGKGGTQCARIDLIAGLASSFEHEDGTFGPPCQDTIMNPNFALDGARVYISQKADIDRYMGIAPSNHLGAARPGASAIGMKADAIRFHARQDIKNCNWQGSFSKPWR